MRDPKRISKTIGLIEQIWLNNPDLRLMQLILNVMDTTNNPAGGYYIEDKELTKRLKDFYQNFSNEV